MRSSLGKLSNKKRRKQNYSTNNFNNILDKYHSYNELGALRNKGFNAS